MTKFLSRLSAYNKSFLFIGMFFFQAHIVAQVTRGNQISGTVVSESGMSLPGVNILVKGTSVGAMTDFDGNYSINVPPGSEMLVFSYIGFETQEIQINDRNVINITMEEDVAALQDVVVIGYGTETRRDLTGAVSQLDSEQIDELPISSFEEALAGQVAGVQLRQTGNPASGPQIIIRGISSLSGNAPLYVVDGIPLTNVTNSNDNYILNSINPNDIASISVLKDASAKAIYGSRASNGVIIVTTKKGKEGKAILSFSASTGIAQVLDFDKPQNLNSLELATFQKQRLEDRYLGRNRWGKYEEAHYTRLQNFIRAAQDDPALAKGTDWFDEITRTAIISNYYLSARGGSENVLYSISGGYRKEEGVIIATGLKQQTLRASVQADVTDRIKVGVNIAPSFVTNISASTEPGSSGFSAANTINSTAWIDPTAKVYDENGNLNSSTRGILTRQDLQGRPMNGGSGLFWTANPVAKILTREQNSKTFTLNTSMFAEVELFKNLTFRTSGYLNYRDRQTFNYTPKTLPGGGLTPDPTGRTNSSSTIVQRRTKNFIYDNQLSYSNTFAEKHDFEATAVFSMENRKAETTRINSTDFVDEDFIYPSSGNTDPENIENFDGSFGISELSRLSILGRISYDFDNTYYLTGSFRRDGSSKFGSDNRFGNFYAFSGAWRISEEDFFQGLKPVISNFRIGGGYGVSGSDANLGNYAWQGNINRNNYILGGSQFPGYGIAGLPNQGLTWEESEEINFGIDLGVFNNKINLRADLYREVSRGFLGRTPIPTATGLGSIVDNVGSIENKGIEIELFTNDLIGSNDGFSYNFNMNVTINRNEILELQNDEEQFIGNAANNTRFAVLRVGDPVGIFQGFKILGFYTEEDIQNPDVPKYPNAVVGSAKVLDGNGDGKIEFSEADYVDIGNPNPDFAFGMRHNFAYKNFDLSILLNGSIGQQIYDQQSQALHNLDGVFNVAKDVLYDRYRPGVPQDIIIPASENMPNGAIIHARPETDINSISIPGTHPNRSTRYWRAPNSYHIKDGDYLWVKNITLGYNITPDQLNMTNAFTQARVYLSIQNPIIFSEYKYGSPEVQRTSDSIVRNVDEGSYPNSSVFTIGLDLNF